MKLILKLKAGATAVGFVTDVLDILTTKALNANSVHVDGVASTIAGVYVPRVAAASGVLFIETEDAAVVGLALGTAHLTLKQYVGFDWTTLTGTTTTGVVEVITSGALNTTALALSATTTICLNIAKKTVVLSGTAPYGTTVSTAPYVNNNFRAYCSGPIDPTRYDGVNATKGVVFSASGAMADKRYGLAGGTVSLNTDTYVDTMGPIVGGSVNSASGALVSHVNPLVVLFPGGAIADGAGELFMCAGRRGLGEVFTDGTRTWSCVFSGHAAFTDVWQSNSMFAELL